MRVKSIKAIVVQMRIKDVLVIEAGAFLVDGLVFMLYHTVAGIKRFVKSRDPIGVMSSDASWDCC